MPLEQRHQAERADGQPERHHRVRYRPHLLPSRRRQPPSTLATITATANHEAAGVDYSSTDADPNTSGHQVNLSAGRNQVTVTVTAEDGSTRDYRVSINRGVTDTYGWNAGQRPGRADCRREPVTVWHLGQRHHLLGQRRHRRQAVCLQCRRLTRRQRRLRHAHCSGQQKPPWHLVQRQHHVGRGQLRPQALRLPHVRQATRQHEGLQYPERRRQYQSPRHLVQRDHHVGQRPEHPQDLRLPHVRPAA